jgi:hypothetical protein
LSKAREDPELIELPHQQEKSQAGDRRQRYLKYKDDIHKLDHETAVRGPQLMEWKSDEEGTSMIEEQKQLCGIELDVGERKTKQVFEFENEMFQRSEEQKSLEIEERENQLSHPLEVPLASRHA